jgi:hypothetical protein
VALLRQLPLGVGEYHIVRTDEIFADMVPNYEQLKSIVDKACCVSIYVVDAEEDEHTFMPLFHSIGRRDTADGENVVPRFNTLAGVELLLIRQGLEQFSVDVVPTVRQLNKAMKSEGLDLTLQTAK